MRLGSGGDPYADPFMPNTNLFTTAMQPCGVDGCCLQCFFSMWLSEMEVNAIQGPRKPNRIDQLRFPVRALAGMLGLEVPEWQQGSVQGCRGTGILSVLGTLRLPTTEPKHKTLMVK